MRTEHDRFGEISIPKTALYGIHAQRAKLNFPDHTRVHTQWYKSIGMTKLACYLTYKDFKRQLQLQFPAEKWPFKIMTDEKLNALITAAEEVSQGKHSEHFIVPGITGGAGTSLNMNVNEIIANRSLELLGKEHGDYQEVDPTEDANIFQSTNDVIPTALKLAIMFQLKTLENEINLTRNILENLEKKHRFDLRLGYTQMQAAVPSSFGKLFSAYSEALSRDWWRVQKCWERIKTVNLGGNAIGTGISVPKYYIFNVVNHLRNLTQLPVARSENLEDATQNLDSLVEVHATLKAQAVNLEKIVSDLRLLASDVRDSLEVKLPQKQVGSSIMPGKINPVIPEFVVSVSHKVYANDLLISGLCGQGVLDLNAYLPAIGDAFLNSLDLLIAATFTLRENLLKDLKINSSHAQDKVFRNSSVTTALIPYIGYHEAEKLARYMQENRCTIYDANRALDLVREENLNDALTPSRLLELGFSIQEILKEK